MRTLYREKRYYCGEYLDVYIFPVYSQARGRSRKSKPTSEAQKKLNKRHSEEKLVRLLHANFTPDDLEIHLTYTEQPESPEDAKRELRNFLRRVQRRRKKLDLPPLKYIAVTEIGSKGRLHHHVTVSGGLDRDELESLWGLGYANSRRFAKAFYESPAWRKTRAYILKRDAGLCVRCGAPGAIVHHKTELTPRNIDDPMITLNEDNLETVCRTCHAIIHEGTPPIADGLAFDEDGNVVEAAAMPMPPRIRDR